MRRLLYTLLVLLFVVRFDVWSWTDARSLLGLPVGLTYHVLVCLLAALLMALLVRYAWPAGLESDREGE